MIRLTKGENGINYNCEINLIFGETSEVGLFGWTYTIYYSDLHYTYDCKEHEVLYDSRNEAFLYAYLKVLSLQEENDTYECRRNQ
jgi:hypothetical protein